MFDLNHIIMIKLKMHQQFHTAISTRNRHLMEAMQTISLSGHIAVSSILKSA